jgi:hypothetical protein
MATQIPTPIIKEAEATGFIDLDLLPGDVTITAAPWPGIAVGQRVWLDVYDVQPDNSTTNTITLYKAAAVVERELKAGLSKALTRSALLTFKTPCSIVVRLRVNLDANSSNEAGAVAAPLRKYDLFRLSAQDYAQSNPPLTR